MHAQNSRFVRTALQSRLRQGLQWGLRLSLGMAIVTVPLIGTSVAQNTAPGTSSDLSEEPKPISDLLSSPAELMRLLNQNSGLSWEEVLANQDLSKEALDFRARQRELLKGQSAAPLETDTDEESNFEADLQSADPAQPYRALW